MEQRRSRTGPAPFHDHDAPGAEPVTMNRRTRLTAILGGLTLAATALTGGAASAAADGARQADGAATGGARPVRGAPADTVIDPADVEPLPRIGVAADPASRTLVNTETGAR